MNSESLLLTGATGLVGRKIIPLLKQNRPDRLLVALVRNPEQCLELNLLGVDTVIGDLTRPRLGLSAVEYEFLQTNLTEILHVAANVRFDLSLEESRAVNVDGVSEILRLAKSSPGLRKFGHVSTAFVNGYREGVFAEEPMPPGQEFVNAYQQTKFEAEGLILEAMAHIPASIYRISLLLADSADGAVSQFNYFHHLIRTLPDSILPVMPGDPDVLIDMVPANWVAAGLAYLFDFRFIEGAIRHLCAGVEGSMRLGDVMTRACRAIEQHASYPVGRSVRLPRLVSVAEYDDFVKTCDDRSLRFIAGMVGPHVRLMGIRQSYLTGKTQSELEGSNLVLPEMLRCLENTVAYCLDTEWGRKPHDSQAGTAHARP
jgi:nucleoside-diphosphate-sugar epimerase